MLLVGSTREKLAVRAEQEENLEVRQVKPVRLADRADALEELARRPHSPILSLSI